MYYQYAVSYLNAMFIFSRRPWSVTWFCRESGTSVSLRMRSAFEKSLCSSASIGATWLSTKPTELRMKSQRSVNITTVCVVTRYWTDNLAWIDFYCCVNAINNFNHIFYMWTSLTPFFSHLFVGNIILIDNILGHFFYLLGESKAWTLNYCFVVIRNCAWIQVDKPPTVDGYATPEQSSWAVGATQLPASQCVQFGRRK